MKPSIETLKKIDASAQLSFSIRTKNNVEEIPKKAKNIKKVFLLFFLSAIIPKNGANNINNKLAVELEIPRTNVRCDSEKEVA